MLKTKNILLLFFSGILITIFVTIPVFQSFLEERILLESKREELRTEDEYIESLAMTVQEIRREEEKVQMIDSAITDGLETPSTIRYIQTTSQNYGMFFHEIASFSTSPSRDFSGIRETRISFLVSGLYDDFKEFLRALELSSKIISVENFSIVYRQLEDEGESENLRFEVTIKTYSY